jgi:O-antigen/teichoic acid export membrane protein
MFALSNEIVGLAYGPKWTHVVPILRVFIIFTIVRSVTAQCAAIYNVVGRTDIGTKVTIGAVPVYLCGIFAGSYWGLTGVAVGVVLARCIIAAVAFTISIKLIHLSSVRAIGIMIPAAVTSTIMGLAVWTVDRLLFPYLGMLSRAVACTVLGLWVYLATMAIVYVSSYREITRILAALCTPVGGALTYFGKIISLTGAVRRI